MFVFYKELKVSNKRNEQNKSKKNKIKEIMRLYVKRSPTFTFWVRMCGT